jgi:hypothetical protein
LARPWWKSLPEKTGVPVMPTLLTVTKWLRVPKR